MNKKKPKKTFIDHMLTVILILAIGVFGYAGYHLVDIFLEYKEGTDEYQELSQLAVTYIETEEKEKAEETSSEMILDESENEEIENEEIENKEIENKESENEKESFLKKIIYNLEQMEETEEEETKEKATKEKATNTTNITTIKPEIDEESNIEESIEKITLSQLAEAILCELPNFQCSTVQAPIEVDFEALQEINEDIIGWIYVEGIEEINYPIVQGEDNETYLHTTYEGNYNFAGTLFIDYMNHRDFKDCNTIIYGHNMKNGSMFGKLRKFVSDLEIYEKSKYFWILTPEGNYRYEIVSAYTTAVNSQTYTLFYKRDESFKEYLEYIRDCSEIETSMRRLAVWDKVVTLSTCTGNDATRFVVQGIRVNIS